MTKKKKRNVVLNPKGVNNTSNEGSSGKVNRFKSKGPSKKTKNNHQAAKAYISNLSTTPKKKLTQKKEACSSKKGMLKKKHAPKQGWDGSLLVPVPLSMGAEYPISGNSHGEGRAPFQGLCANQGRKRPYIGSSFNETPQRYSYSVERPASVNMRQSPNGGWDGNFESSVPTYGDENLLLETPYEEVQSSLQPCTSQGRKRSFIDDGYNHPYHMDKRKRLSEYCWDGNTCNPEPPSESYLNQNLGGSLGQAHDYFQKSCNEQGRKRPYIDNTSICTSAVELHTEKRRRLSADFTYRLYDDSNNHQSNNYDIEKNGTMWTSNNSNEAQLGVNSVTNKQWSNTEESITYKLAIVTSDYPATLFKFEQFDTVQMAIFEKLESTPDPLPIIHLGHMNNLKAIPVTCEGRNSANFLYSFDGKVIDGNIKLKIIDAADIPRPIKMGWRSRNVICQDLNRVMRMLQRCNPTLRTALWRVLKTESETQSVRRIVLVDCVSAEYIKSKNYSIPDGLARSKFKLLGSKSRIRLAAEETSSNKIGLETAVNKSLQNNLQGNEVTVNNYPQNDLEGYEMEDGDPLFNQSQGGGTDCSLWEIREPVVTIDLTEGYSSCEDGENFTGEM